MRLQEYKVHLNVCKRFPFSCYQRLWFYLLFSVLLHDGTSAGFFHLPSERERQHIKVPDRKMINTFFFVGRQLQLSDDGSLMRWSPRPCELSTGVSINPQVRITSQHISRNARQLQQRRAQAAVGSLMEASAGGSRTDGAESSSPAEPSSVTFWHAPVQTLN